MTEVLSAMAGDDDLLPSPLPPPVLVREATVDAGRTESAERQPPSRDGAIPGAKRAGRAKKKKKASGKKLPLDVGSNRGIESMLRNSYRAQLSMIALAARKANIMISVNGFLLSVLTLGSAYILTSEPLLLIPSGIFLVTCITAILFAVLAARPHNVDQTKTRLKDFRNDRADLLVFEHFSNLSKDDHMTVMLEMMGDRDRVYKSMVAHLHFLGTSADRRFRTLQVSYTAFIVGLILSFSSLVIIVTLYYL